MLKLIYTYSTMIMRNNEEKLKNISILMRAVFPHRDKNPKEFREIIRTIEPWISDDEMRIRSYDYSIGADNTGLIFYNIPLPDAYMAYCHCFYGDMYKLVTKELPNVLPRWEKFLDLYLSIIHSSPTTALITLENPDVYVFSHAVVLTPRNSDRLYIMYKECYGGSFKKKIKQIIRLSELSDNPPYTYRFSEVIDVDILYKADSSLYIISPVRSRGDKCICNIL